MTVLPRRALTTVAVATLVAMLSACAAEDPSAGVESISRDELESQVAAMYPAKDEQTTVSVACDGELPARAGASEECRVQVNKQRATLRVSVTEVVGEEVRIDSVVVVPAERLAEELLAALMDEGYHVEKVSCPRELAGTEGAKVTCTVTPNKGNGHVVATVTAVRGLHIDFGYEVAS